MALTMGEVIAEIQLTAASVPALLIRSWALDVYSQLLTGSRWGWQKAQTTIRPAAARTLASVGLGGGGGATVTSAGLFLAADVGKLLWLGQGEPTLLITVFTDANTVTVAPAYSGTAVSATDVQVIDGLWQPPADFQQFSLLTDLANGRQIPFELGLEQIRQFDPGEQQQGQPRALVSRGQLLIPPGTSRRPTYQWWPRNTTGGVYLVDYLASPTLTSLSEDTELPGVLQDRPYVLKTGILAKCAAYPGTPETKNPYFNLGLAQKLETEFAVGRKDLAIVDDDQHPSQVIDDVDWQYVRGGRTSDQSYQWSDAIATDGGAGWPY